MVEDNFAILKKTAISSFHDTLNSIEPSINFTIEHEKDGQIAFLDTLISRHNNSISINIYRKPTHTDRHLDYSSHHHHRHKISAATTLINRSLNLPSSGERKVRELNHVNEALTASGYPKRLASRLIQEQKSNSIPCPEDLVRTFFESLEPTQPPSEHAVLPYIKCLTEPFTKVLRKHDIKVCNRPLQSLPHDFPSVKYRPPQRNRQMSSTRFLAKIVHGTTLVRLAGL